MDRAAHFAFGEASQDGRTARFGFACSRHGTFTETVTFESGGVVPRELLTLLHVALGVSTYKAAAAQRITFPPLSPAGRAMAEALYTHGLAEFFVRNALPFPPATVFDGEITDDVAPAPVPDGEPLVAFGGGKDSYVAGAIVERASGSAPRYASVVLSDAVQDALTAMAPSPLLFLRRTLDQKLLGLEDAFTGHVPITAINILVMTCEGFLRGSGPILFANERSADEPTLKVDGIEANHQYSKSSVFEGLLRQAVIETGVPAPLSYSVLRPFSELWIGQRFAGLEDAFGRFTSCNRNFRLAGDAERRWCAACPKCAFTSLILSPFLTAAQAGTIFPEPMLDAEALQPFFRELCGLSEQKPWECVGTIDECQGALYLLSKRDDWKGSRVVRDLLPELLGLKSEDMLIRQIAEALEPAAADALPPSLYRAALSL